MAAGRKMMNNRIGILQVCGEEGIEKYVYYLASELKKIVRKLVIVSNGKLSELDRQKVTEITTHLYEREDIGYDSGAFKDTLENFITWDKIKQYEELILVNDSCYGPIYPFKEMFDEMDKNRKDLDFWSVTEQAAYSQPLDPDNDIPYHIQPYFVVVRKRLMYSEAFKNFWDTLILPNNYMEAIYNYELRFASYFNNLGYKGGAYIDNSEFCRTKNERMAYVFHNTYKLVSEYKSPLIKRKAFKNLQNVMLAANAGEVASKTLEYIRKNTMYDSDMILDDMLHHMELDDIQEILHLYYIVSEQESTRENKKICIYFFLNDMDYARNCMKRIRLLSTDVVVYIESNNEDIVNVFNNCNSENVIVSDNIVNYFDENLEFDYYCIFVDNLSEFDFAYQSVKQSYIDLILDNMIASLNYIKKVTTFFEEDKRLGILIPPTPFFSNLSTQKKERKRRKTNHENGFFTFNNAFWIRKELVGILENSMSDSPKDLGIKLYKGAKQMRYYYGIITSEMYASLYISYVTNLNNLFNNMIQYTNQVWINRSIQYFCSQYRKLYVYGAGEYGHYCLNYIRKNNLHFMGFVVTKKNDSCKQSNNKIYEISELNMNDDEGMIIAVGDEHYEDVLCEIQQKGIKNTIRFTESRQ